ncbi:hypothetical protein IFO70_10380 [Phormidium tenue FACHB-886]|nr:hypothetical protein [Phormidium tenue FACHB-886]
MRQIDPFWIYKAGEMPRKVHGVDFPAWAAQGWSKEAPVDTEPTEAQAEPVEPDKPKRRKAGAE